LQNAAQGSCQACPCSLGLNHTLVSAIGTMAG
jgi:hypothetical protein